MKVFDCNIFQNAVKFTRLSDDERIELIKTHKILMDNQEFVWDEENQVVVVKTLTKEQ